MNSIVAPSILSADFATLHTEVQSVLNAGAQWIHVDVMDGRFVPNITMGPIVVKALRRRFNCPLDVHLMIEEPERYIDDFIHAGATTVSIHVEATSHVHRALQQIHSQGSKAGLAINPGTGLDMLPYLCDNIDLLLIMTVNPGFGGQKFIPAMLQKIAHAREVLDRNQRQDVPIEVDGGITIETIGEARLAGADIFVAGSAVFTSPDRQVAVAELLAAAMETGSDNR